MQIIYRTLPGFIILASSIAFIFAIWSQGFFFILNGTLYQFKNYGHSFLNLLLFNFTNIDNNTETYTNEYMKEIYYVMSLF